MIESKRKFARMSTSPIKKTKPSKLYSKFKFRYQCIACPRFTTGVRLMPCNHLIVCSFCAQNLRTCPSCSCTIDNIIWK